MDKWIFLSDRLLSIFTIISCLTIYTLNVGRLWPLPFHTLHQQIWLFSPAYAEPSLRDHVE